MSPPLPSSPVPLGLSFARLASVSSPTNRVQSQSAVKIGARDRGDTITAGTAAAAAGNNTARPTFRSLPYKSPTITSASFNLDPEPITRAKTINITANISPPMTTVTATIAAPTTVDVITRPTPTGPRSIGGKQKLQLSLQIPSIPLLGQEQEEQGGQNKNKKPQLPALKLITDTILHPASTASSPSIKLSPSPSSPSPLSYVSYSLPHSPVSPAATNAKPSSSPTQLSPTHSLFSADSRIHLHPLSPISGTTSGSASVRTSVRGWVIGGSTGEGGGGGGVSPGGKSVNSLGGRRPRSVRSSRSSRSNRSRRSTNNKVKIHNIPVSTPNSASCIPTPKAIYSTDAFAYTHLGILGDHVGEFVGDGDGEERNGFVYGGYGYIEDGWGGGRSPSPIRYARSDSRGILNNDTEDDDGGGGGVYGGGVSGGKKGAEDDSAASSEVEFADAGGDSDSDDCSERKVRRQRRSRRWKGSRDRRRDPPTTTTTEPSSPFLPLPQFVQAASHHSSNPSSHSNPSASSPLSSSSSANSYSNPYSTRKDRKRARKTQLRSFRHSYRMPPVVPLEQERGRGRGEEKERGGKSNRTSSPTVMKSMIPFRRKSPPPVTGEEQAEQDGANTSAKKKKKEGKNNKSKDKDKEKGKPPVRSTTAKRKPTISAIDLFNSVSASMSTTYSASASQSQSASTSVLSSHPQSTSSSSSFPALPGSARVVPPSLSSHSIPPPPPLHHSDPRIIRSQSGSGSTFNTRASSPDLIGRKRTHNNTRKKFTEAVSLALEEVTSRGRVASSGSGSGGAPFQPASKTRALTAYSTSSSHSVIPFDEMEVLDIGRLPGGEDDEEGSPGGGKTKDVSGSSSTVPFDEMEVWDISLSGGGTEAEQQQQQMGKSIKKQETPPLAMAMAIKSGDDVRTTCSSLPESGRFYTVYSAGDGSKVSASTIEATASSPLPSSSSHFNSQQHQKQQFRGSSLGREGGMNTNNKGRNSTNKRQYSNPQPYNNRNNSPFQLQPAYTTGISCGLPVSRPYNPRSVVRSSSLVTPPFSAPSGSVMGFEMGVSSSPSPSPLSSPFVSRSRSVRLFVPTSPPFSPPIITVSDPSAVEG
jgi:hypothetical protein